MFPGWDLYEAAHAQYLIMAKMYRTYIDYVDRDLSDAYIQPIRIVYEKTAYCRIDVDVHAA